MDIYAQIAIKIIAAQEAIIGPVAIEQAEQVRGLVVDWAKHAVTIKGGGSGAGANSGRTGSVASDADEAAVIDLLVRQYKGLFGQISVEVSKESAAALMAQLPAGGLPEALK